MKKVAYALLTAGLGIVFGQAQASTISFGYNLEFSGGQAPAGSGPWMTATFDDHNNTAVPLTLTMASSGMSGSEKISDVYFNLNPLLTPGSLVLSHVSGATATGITLGVDCCKADGDGLYDIKLSFSTSNNNLFQSGQTVVYNITGISGLTASSFNFFSTPAGGHGPFLAAAHVLNTTGAGSGGSGWIAPTPVPLPAAAWLFGSGLLGLAGIVRKRKAA